MNFNHGKPLDTFLNILFDSYCKNVPAVDKITDTLIVYGVIDSPHDIVNDHIAFRTLAIPHLGIKSFEKIFLHHGYEKRDYYYFESKKLNAYWYAPPSEMYPRIFISELIVDQLSDHAQKIIKKYTGEIKADPVDELDLNSGEQIGAFFLKTLWKLPALADYLELLKESEYAAWVIYNRYYLNHYTISVHALKEGYNTLVDFNELIEGIGIRLNDQGGKIKISADGLLRQSSTVAEMHEATFAGGETMKIAGSYVEFAERLILPQFSHLLPGEATAIHRREGFETNNADKIFESTYLNQVNTDLKQ